MSKQSWDEFMGTKKRTAKLHFSQGRKCSRCGVFITDESKTGFCLVCFQGKQVAESYKDRLGESPEHLHLKDLAVKWLERIGAEKIRKEVGIRTNRGKIIADVAGEYKGKRIIVECGGSHKRKLGKALSITPSVYIWPYHYTKPYLYKRSINVCQGCGNLKGHSGKK